MYKDSDYQKYLYLSTDIPYRCFSTEDILIAQKIRMR